MKHKWLLKLGLWVTSKPSYKSAIPSQCHASINTSILLVIATQTFKLLHLRNPFVRKAREAYVIDKHQLLAEGLNKKLIISVFLCFSSNKSLFLVHFLLIARVLKNNSKNVFFPDYTWCFLSKCMVKRWIKNEKS